MLFSKTDSRSTLQYLASLVTEGVERYNAQHPEDQVGITARSRIKTADENSFEFLRGVMDNREAGNEMRDIVSMISELDRLDEELRLASDIQVNMLPMRLAVIEISTGRGKACNAGHENPVMKRAGGKYEVLRYRHNMALGISKMAKYTVREFELHPGDSLFVYTDGVPEATNNAMEMFGEDRLVSTLNRNRDTQPKEVIAHMREAVDAFADGAPQFDDVTMLCLKCLGRRED